MLQGQLPLRPTPPDFAPPLPKLERTSGTGPRWSASPSWATERLVALRSTTQPAAPGSGCQCEPPLDAAGGT